MTEPLSVPLDQQIIGALAARLAGISIAGGYRTDIGADVRTEELPPEDDPVKAVLCVLDPAEALKEASGRKRTADLNLVLQAVIPVVQVDETAAVEAPRALARLIFADIRRVVAGLQRDVRSPRENPLPGVSDIRMGGRRISFREAGSNFIVAELDVVAAFTEQFDQ